MSNKSDIVEVTLVAGAKVRRHQASGFHVDERGNLVLALESRTVSVYAAGQWARAERAGNVLEKE
jgi:hypothetical protein